MYNSGCEDMKKMKKNEEMKEKNKEMCCHYIFFCIFMAGIVQIRDGAFGQYI